MTLLLDTHAAFWAVIEPELLTAGARAVLQAPDVAAYVSVASLWELTIKHAQGKWELSNTLAEHLQLYESAGFQILPIIPAHLVSLSGLDLHHRDPFDRILIAQAIAEGLTFLTKDAVAASYPVRTFW